MDFVVTNSNSLQMNSNSTPISSMVFSLPTFAIVRQQVTRNVQFAAYSAPFPPYSALFGRGTFRLAWGRLALILRRQRGKACLPAQAGILAMNLATPPLARLLRRKPLFSSGFMILAGILTGAETP